MRRPELTIKQILEWADAYHERTGNWPTRKSGRVWEPPDETWRNLNSALWHGYRGLRKGQSLPRLLAKYRGRRNRKALPRLTIQKILDWADAHHGRKGRWPHRKDGLIPNTNGETWFAVEMALSHGQRGLAGGASLVQVLAAHRAVRNRRAPPTLSIREILRWADGHHAKTGNWPTTDSGPIRQSAGDTWLAIDKALRAGRRGLRKSSLAKLLAQHRGVLLKHHRLPPLTTGQILKWADSFHGRTGKWPNLNSGPIPEATGESWQRLHTALVKGARGLRRWGSLAKFIAVRRKLRTKLTLPKLSSEKVTVWTKAFRRRHGYWPLRTSGDIPGSQGETWSAIDNAFKRGSRGLPRRGSLSKFIRHRFHIPAARLIAPKKAAQPSSP